MGGKRKGVGSGYGAVRKKCKVPTKQPEEETDILAIKITAATAVRKKFHNIVLPWIAKKSIMSTKICELASLLFLNKVRAKFEEEDLDFFDGDGAHIIEGCFFAVLRKNKENEDMLPEFRETFETVNDENRMQWLENTHFGNLFKYLIQQYIRNVTTNLNTHKKKRLKHYFKLIAWEHNNNVHDDNPNGPNHTVIDDVDIDNALRWAIERYDSTRGNQARIFKREILLNSVRVSGGPDDLDITSYTRDQWFHSLPMWLRMQEKITFYNDWLQKQDKDYIEKGKLPQLRNLTVIPLCGHLRKNIRIDADVLYHMMCETKIIPRNKDGTQVNVAYICRSKEFYFNQIFNMQKIRRVLKANKQFRYHIVSDGVSASILYNIPKNVLQKLESDEIVKRKYYDGYYVYEIGIDPGMKTWLAAVRRHIDTGKEVC